MTSGTLPGFPEQTDWVGLLEPVAQEHRRLTQAWLKVVGRRKYKECTKKDNNDFLDWCQRTSRREYWFLLETLAENWQEEPGFVMVQNAIAKARKEQELKGE